MHHIFFPICARGPREFKPAYLEAIHRVPLVVQIGIKDILSGAQVPKSGVTTSRLSEPISSCSTSYIEHVFFFVCLFGIREFALPVVRALVVSGNFGRLTFKESYSPVTLL